MRTLKPHEVREHARRLILERVNQLSYYHVVNDPLIRDGGTTQGDWEMIFKEIYFALVEVSWDDGIREAAVDSILDNEDVEP